jgi:hypothetical protein
LIGIPAASCFAAAGDSSAAASYNLFATPASVAPRATMTTSQGLLQPEGTLLSRRDRRTRAARHELRILGNSRAAEPAMALG